MLQAPRFWFLKNSLQVKFQLINLVRSRVLAGGSVVFQSPRPHGGAVVHDCFVGGGGGIEMFQGKKKIYLFILFYFYFQKKCNPPLPQRWLVALSHSTMAPPWGWGDWNVSRKRKNNNK
jgi:hypothetical protein